MTEILAATGTADFDEQVTGMAAIVGEVVGADMRPVSLTAEPTAERAAARALREMGEPAVAVAVLPGDEPNGPIWRRVIQASAKPVILVPAAVRGRQPRLRRVLLPLDGSPQAAAAVAGSIEQFARAGVDLVVLHVFDADTVPRFWDHPAHGHHAWTQEFLARNCARPGVRLELRSGAAGDHILKVALREGADLIALGWSQRLDKGRAHTVRQAIAAALVPVMLVPVAPGPRDVGP
jgi:nucleotide-binding universal stress UspA family protein